MPDKLLESLRGEHRNVAALLDVLERQLIAVRDDDAPDYELMQQVVHYVSGHPDSYHFPLEDRLFAHPVTRRLELGHVTAALSRQHDRLKTSGLALADAIAQILCGQPVSRNDLLRLGATFIDEYRQHLSREEVELFAPIAARLDIRERRALDRELTPPASCAKATAHQFHALADRLDADGMRP